MTKNVAWVLTTVVPMPGWISMLIIAVAVIGGLLYALQSLGVGGPRDGI